MKKISIVTRHMATGRERSLRRLLASMSTFDLDTYEHIILTDLECKGVSSANSLFEKNKDLIQGDYVYMMDDDDWFICTTFPQDLLRFIEQQSYPDIIMMKFKIVDKNLPQPWGNFAELKFCKVGTPNFCLKREVWLKHIKYFTGPSGGDFRMIQSLQAESYSVAWWEQLVGMTRQKHGYGRSDRTYHSDNSGV